MATTNRPTPEQMREVAKAFNNIGGTVSEVMNRVADSFRKIFTPRLMLTMHHLLLAQTPRWRFIRRYRLKRRIRELEQVVGNES